MKCPKCKGDMVKVCDPVTKKCYWICNDCGYKRSS